jgi:glycosyltransferase involved in cell wall biosynthesis
MIEHEKQSPKVSVCVVTYNQENYIYECLQSIVAQVTNFEFEVIASDDCSTDRTREIVREFAVKYPCIKPVLREQNIGPFQNFIQTHNMAQGEYVCHMDGDDYALPGKLQAQADFMDKTPDCNICFHRVKALFPDGTLKDDLVDYEKIKDGFERKDLLMYMSVGAHSSKMYRLNRKNFEIPKFNVLDFYVNVEQIGDKKAYFVNEKIYGVYRVGAGISTDAKPIIKEAINDTMNHFVEKYPKEKKYINSMFLVLFLADFKNKRDYKLYMNGWLKSFCFSSIFLTVKTWKIRRMFRAPK